MTRRRMSLLLIAPILYWGAGCDRGTAPSSPEASNRTSAQMALAGSNSQTFDLAIHSTTGGQTSGMRVMHIARLKTGNGWRTSIRIDPTPVPKGRPPVRNEITSIEIDENGKRMVSIEGRPAVPFSQGRMSVGKGREGFSVTTEAPVEQAAVASDPFDILSRMVFAKSESESRKARAGAKLGTPVARNGRLVYRQNTAQGPAEFEYDAISGLAMRIGGPAPQGKTMVVEHTYKEAGGLFIRTTTKNTLASGQNSRVITLSLSHVTVDGKEIVQ